MKSLPNKDLGSLQSSLFISLSCHIQFLVEISSVVINYIVSVISCTFGIGADDSVMPMAIHVFHGHAERECIVIIFFNIRV